MPEGLLNHPGTAVQCSIMERQSKSHIIEGGISYRIPPFTPRFALQHEGRNLAVGPDKAMLERLAASAGGTVAPLR
jgi:hypothetical protein